MILAIILCCVSQSGALDENPDTGQPEFPRTHNGFELNVLFTPVATPLLRPELLCPVFISFLHIPDRQGKRFRVHLSD